MYFYVIKISENRRADAMRLLLNSKGLNTMVGTKMIGEYIKPDGLDNKKIYCVSLPEYEVDEIIKTACISIGFKPENIFMSVDGIPMCEMDYIYVTEGNVFTILEYMRNEGIEEYIKAQRDKKNVTYIGSSAGAAIAGEDVKIAIDFDQFYARISDFRGLGFYEGIIIPHMTKEKLKLYLENADPYLIARYSKIEQVANDEMKVMEI